MMSEVSGAQPKLASVQAEAPELLHELEPWHRVFARNLGDFLLRREPPPVETTAQPVPVPPEKFISINVPVYRFAESYGGHIAFVALVYFLSTSSLFNRPVKLASPYENTRVEYYPPVSEYLPPVNTGQSGPAKPRRGEPKLAKQEILSVPPQADNTHQTIVTPPKVKLNRDVPLPNMVAWTPVPARQPIAASNPRASQLKLPNFEQQVVEPTADVSGIKPKLLVPPELRPTVVEPTADVSGVKPKLKLAGVAQPSVVEPAVSVDQLKLKSGPINMAQLQPQVEAPTLPVTPQRDAGTGDPGQAAGKAGAPPQPSLQGLSATRGQGQIIALSLNPADVRGPVELPNGNRSGEFHASPGGKADAPGTPNIPGNPNATSSGSGSSSGKGNGAGSGNSNGAPSGIVVGAPPSDAAPSAVAGSPGSKPADPQGEERRRIIAAAMKPSLPDVTRHLPPPEPPASLEDHSIESRVFGKKPYYSLVLNMPNLTSATGSWIIRFAELKQTGDKTAPTAPVAMTKVDPAYSPDALRDRVEGTVTLYAVIGADGSVSALKVLDSLDDRLDESAMRAFSHWHFQPGTKNGAPIAVEAVVQIPFRLRKF